MHIKIKFLADDKPFGREYTYNCMHMVNVGDIVLVTLKTKGIVTAINIPESEVLPYADKIKTIVGKETV